MALTKRENSPFWYIEFMFDKKRYVKSTKTKDKKVAARMEREWRAKVHAEAHLLVKDESNLEDALLAYLDTKSSKSASYKLNLEKRINQMAYFFGNDKMIHNITSADIERFVKWLRTDVKNQDPTIRIKLNILKGLFQYMHRMGFKTPELLWPDHVGKNQHRCRYLTRAEERRLLWCLDPDRHYFVKGWGDISKVAHIRQHRQDCLDIAKLLLDTGARVGELMILKWSQVNFKQRYIRLVRPKVKNESHIYLTKRAYDVLADRFRRTRKSEYIFPGSHGREFRSTSVSAIRNAIKRARIPDCRLHDLRHTCASRLVQSGLRLQDVKEILGHTDIQTTLRYAHLENTEASQRAAAALDTFNYETDTAPEAELHPIRGTPLSEYNKR